MRRFSSTCVLSTLLATTGCGDELHPSQVIEKNRVLGARTEVLGAPQRAWPAPGEAARVRFLVVDPGERAPLGYALAVCVRDASLGGVPACDGPIFGERRIDVPELGEPSVDFVVPSASELGDRRSLLVFGVVCARGAPSTPGGLIAAWPDRAGCTEADALPTRVLAHVTVSTDGSSNGNPSLSDDLFQQGGSEWTSTPDPWALPPKCGATSGTPAVPIVSAGTGALDLSLSLLGDDRESTPEGREALTLASFSTAGELDRPFSVVESDDASDPPVISWAFELPKSAPVEGRLVLFHFVMRDGRGGTDFATRALCVVP